jgi:hypothetical protein
MSRSMSSKWTRCAPSEVEGGKKREAGRESVRSQANITVPSYQPLTTPALFLP